MAPCGGATPWVNEGNKFLRFPREFARQLLPPHGTRVLVLGDVFVASLLCLAELQLCLLLLNEGFLLENERLLCVGGIGELVETLKCRPQAAHCRLLSTYLLHYDFVLALDNALLNHPQNACRRLRQPSCFR